MDFKPAAEAIEAIIGTIPINQRPELFGKLQDTYPEHLGPVAINGAQAEETAVPELNIEVQVGIGELQHAGGRNAVCVELDVFEDELSLWRGVADLDRWSRECAGTNDHTLGVAAQGTTGLSDDTHRVAHRRDVRVDVVDTAPHEDGSTCSCCERLDGSFQVGVVAICSYDNERPRCDVTE